MNQPGSQRHAPVDMTFVRQHAWGCEASGGAEGVMDGHQVIIGQPLRLVDGRKPCWLTALRDFPN
jgi:hypothetical protein